MSGGVRGLSKVALAVAAGGVASGAASLACERTAGAVEREQQIGVDIGGAVLTIKDKSTPDVGGALGLHYSYGLSDAFNFVAEGGWSLVALDQKLDNPDTPHTRPASIFNANVGLAYVLDVLRWVPWGAVLVGGYALTGGTIDSVKWLPGAEIALGLDYRFDRSWAAGVTARETFLTETSTYTSFTQAFARIEYTWGW
jgi:hypothetical protein